MTSVLEELDWIVLGIYFLALIGVAVWVFIQKNKNTEDYFLAGRNVGWFVIGASIFASNIGSEHVVGLAGTGFESGTPMAHYELHAWIVLLLGWLFLPFYIRSGAFTTPEFLEKRFDSRSRWFLSIFSLLAYVLTKVSITIYAGGIVVSELLGIPFWYGAIGIVVFYGSLYCCWRVESGHLHRNASNHCSYFWFCGHHRPRTTRSRWVGTVARNSYCGESRSFQYVATHD
jgi:SSS family solute:Na+ symporter